MSAFVCVLAFLANIPAHRTYDTGHGYSVAVTQGGSDLGYSEKYFASTIGVLHGGVEVAKVTARTLIDGWLKSDAMWGGHDAANQMRYLDQPKTGVIGGLEGTVFEVMPFADGCLLRIGVINICQSFPPVEKDVIVSWRPNDPNQWQVRSVQENGTLANAPVKRFARYRGEDYIVYDSEVSRLSPDPSKDLLVAKLPSRGPFLSQGDLGHAWFGYKQVGRRLVLFQPHGNPHSDVFATLDLLTGKTTRPSDAQLRQMGIVRPPSNGSPY